MNVWMPSPSQEQEWFWQQLEYYSQTDGQKVFLTGSGDVNGFRPWGSSHIGHLKGSSEMVL